MRASLPRPRLPRGRVLLGAAVVGVSALLIAGPLGIRSLLTGPSVAVIEVKPERFVREVKVTGALKAVEATPVTVPTDADTPQKIAWMATEGLRVKTGDPVVLFDPSEMQKALADGQADRTTATNKLGKTAAENRKSAASLTLDLSVAQQELDQKAILAPKDTDVFARNDIIESEIDRGLLKKRRESAEFKKQASSKLGATDVALGEIERSKADIRIRQAEKSLGSLRVLAPHDGIIMFERNWRGESLGVGETVWPGQKIAEIPDLRALEAKVYVLEADAGGLAPGLAARITIEGRPGREFDGKVTRVDAMATTRDWRVPTKYFETILSLDRADLGFMKPGQAVRATILLEKIEAALSVPRGAVLEKDGKRIVYRLRAGHFSPVEVTVGHNSLARVVIEKGLEAGDRIALRDPSRSASEIFQTQETGPTGGSQAGPAGSG